MSGSITRAEAFSSGNRTIVLLDLEERESVFLIFKKEKTEAPSDMRLLLVQELQIPGPWNVNFPPDLMHKGGHGAMPSDYPVFIEFMKMHFGVK